MVEAGASDPGGRGLRGSVHPGRLERSADPETGGDGGPIAYEGAGFPDPGFGTGKGKKPGHDLYRSENPLGDGAGPKDFLPISAVHAGEEAGAPARGYTGGGIYRFSLRHGLEQ